MCQRLLDACSRYLALVENLVYELGMDVLLRTCILIGKVCGVFALTVWLTMLAHHIGMFDTIFSLQPIVMVALSVSQFLRWTLASGGFLVVAGLMVGPALIATLLIFRGAEQAGYWTAQIMARHARR